MRLHQLRHGAAHPDRAGARCGVAAPCASNTYLSMGVIVVIQLYLVLAPRIPFVPDF
jgi:hypothetical protein